MKPFDLHIHSDMSDGTYAPEQLPTLALERGVELMALTDHDTAAGCRRAVDAGRKIGVKVICGMEIDAEFSSELHILALDIDPEHPGILAYEQWRRGEREDRNRKILAKLRAMGMDVEPYMEHSKGNDTRLHIAKALVTGGYAGSLTEAFDRYIGSGAPAYEPSKRISRRDAVELAASAGGSCRSCPPLQAEGRPTQPDTGACGLWTVGHRGLLSNIHPGAGKAVFVSGRAVWPDSYLRQRFSWKKQGDPYRCGIQK